MKNTLGILAVAACVTFGSSFTDSGTLKACHAYGYSSYYTGSYGYWNGSAHHGYGAAADYSGTGYVRTASYGAVAYPSYGYANYGYPYSYGYPNAYYGVPYSNYYYGSGYRYGYTPGLSVRVGW